jgi:type I restriction enzyme M protein
LIVEIIEPFHGRIFDPACGSGGMFVQSAEFVRRHQKSATSELTVFGTEKDSDTVKLAKMNLAVHGLSGDIREANSYYEDPHKSLDRFDFVMANPPFNVNGVDKDRLKADRRFPFGFPSTDNANYLWIQLFYSALNDSGRAGFVMANPATGARGFGRNSSRRAPWMSSSPLARTSSTPSSFPARSGFSTKGRQKPIAGAKCSS